MLGIINMDSVLLQVRSTYERSLGILQTENSILLKELASAREERERLMSLLERALHLEPRPQLVDQEFARQQTPGNPGRNWKKMQAELEARHRRPSGAPEDVAQEYWAKKNEQLEKQNADLDQQIG